MVRGDTLRGDKVEVVVRGEAKSAQRLTAIIRENFSRIHGDLKELNPIETVEVTGQNGLFLDVAALTNTEAASRQAAIPTAMGDVQVDKTRELNRLTPQKARKGRASPLRVFVSYAHVDETWKDAFGLHLDILRNEKLIQEWNDRRILPGQDWDREIRRELEEADLVIFLASTPFLASGYIQGVEVRLAMTREKAGKTVIIPVILKDCAWKEQRWKKNQVLPKDGKPISHWGRRDEAWHDIERGIRRTVAGLRKKPVTGDVDVASE
jgi:internalin A